MRHLRLVPLLVAPLPACRGVDSALADARERVAKLRPAVDLRDVRIVGFTSREARAALDGDGAGEALSLPFARRLLAAQGPVLERLSVVERGGVEALRSDLLEDAGWMAAFVVPSAGVVVVRPSRERDVDLLAHELGHHASFRQGYWKAGEAHLSLRPDRALDPAWVDLDAYLACWAVEEGIAELTALASAADPELVLAREAAQPVEFGEGPLLEGPGTIVFADRRYVLAAGEKRHAEIGLGARVLELTYRHGRRFVASRARGSGPLESRFGAVWSTFEGTTAALLAAGAAGERSAWATALRAAADEIRPRITGATRIGAFFVFDCLSRRGTPAAAALLQAAALRDDLVLVWPETRCLWLTRWRDDPAAEAFAAFAGRELHQVAVRRNGSVVVVDAHAPEGNAESVLAGR